MGFPVKPEEALEQIAQAVRSVRYGTVQVVIHDSRIVQIEKLEKIRLEKADQTSGGLSSSAARTDQTAGGTGPLEGDPGA